MPNILFFVSISTNRDLFVLNPNGKTLDTLLVKVGQYNDKREVVNIPPKLSPYGYLYFEDALKIYEGISNENFRTINLHAPNGKLIEHFSQARLAKHLGLYPNPTDFADTLEFKLFATDVTHCEENEGAIYIGYRKKIIHQYRDIRIEYKGK